MTTGPGQEERIVGQVPRPEDAEAVEWARDMARKEIVILQESLKQFVTLTSALLAGSAVFFDDAAMPKGLKIAGVVFLLASLAASTLGSLPYEAKVRPGYPEDAREARSKATKHKRGVLKMTVYTFMAAFGCFVVGMLWQAWAGPSDAGGCDKERVIRNCPK